MGCFRKAVGLKQGFTLIELMVVVAIIAFVTAAVMPSFSMALLKNRQREAAILITEAVFTARTRAAQTNHCHQVRVRLDANSVAAGGSTGGVVQIREYPLPATCTEASTQPLANWNLLSARAVGGGVDPEVPGVLPMLVGNDVSINSVLWHNPGCQATPDPNPVAMYFDPSGGLSVLANGNAIERYFVIRANGGGGQVGLDKQVRISSGGNIRDAACQ